VLRATLPSIVLSLWRRSGGARVSRAMLLGFAWTGAAEASVALARTAADPGSAPT
jgi:hypothetical protein